MKKWYLFFIPSLAVMMMGCWGDSKNAEPPIGPRHCRVALCAVENIDTVDLL